MLVKKFSRPSGAGSIPATGIPVFFASDLLRCRRYGCKTRDEPCSDEISALQAKIWRFDDKISDFRPFPKVKKMPSLGIEPGPPRSDPLEGGLLAGSLFPGILSS